MTSANSRFSSFIPIVKMTERLEHDLQESDQAYFYSLLYYGEFLSKLITVSLLAGVSDDKHRHKYRNEHQLVRANGIGEWSTVINDLLTGSASQYLNSDLLTIRRQLTGSVSNEDWEYVCVQKLLLGLSAVDSSTEPLGKKTSLKNWFPLFARLRNSSRGHGALTGKMCSEACLHIKESIDMMISNLDLFNLQWAYVKRNISGRYHVVKISGASDAFDFLRDSGEDWKETTKFGEGIYYYCGDSYFFVSLLNYDSNIRDYYLPNGAFTKNRFEVISYITGQIKHLDNSDYLQTPTELPDSETSSKKELDLIGNTFTNIPRSKDFYVPRPKLEKELQSILIDDRHPVVTLVGKGGIGKTSTALQVLPRICLGNRFELIVWFSARDIDLMAEGIKPVKPDVLDIKDLSTLYAKLISAEASKDKSFDALGYMTKELGGSENGKVLFVMDNFETVSNTVDVYEWLNTHIRLPNKLLITSRLRDFKADYPIQVKGLQRPEFDQLVSNVSELLSIEKLVSKDYINELYDESQGHPYIVKILLGELAKEGKQGKIKRILATKDDVLVALFERTYAGLSPAAKRVFLTLASWRSTIPEIAIEAVLMREENDKMDVDSAIDELNKSSFIELIESAKDKTRFLSLPLASYEFGQKKLKSSPMKSAVELDNTLLQKFGVGKEVEIMHGVSGRVTNFFKSVAKEKNPLSYAPLIEFICRRHPSFWMTYSKLHQEQLNYRGAIDAVQRFVESVSDEKELYKGWSRINQLYLFTKDYQGQVNSLVELATMDSSDLEESSAYAGQLLSILGDKKFGIDTEEKKILIQKLIDCIENKINETSIVHPNTMSNLAWLYIHINNRNQARNWVTKALLKDRSHVHSLKLLDNLGMKLKK